MTCHRLRNLGSLASLLALAALAVGARADTMPERFSPDQAAAALHDSQRIHLANARLDAAGAAPAPSAATEYWIVRVAPPASSAARDALEAAGGRVLRYVPNHAYVVHARADAARAIAARPDWTIVAPYRAEYRVASSLAGHGGLVVVALFETAEVSHVAAAMAHSGARVESVQPNARPRLVVDPRDIDAATLAAIEGVEWIEPVGDLELRNDTVRWVLQSNELDVTPLRAAGLLGQNQIIGHIDGPIFHENCYFADPNELPGPNHRKIVAYRSSAGYANHAHGTHTGGTLAGDAEFVGGPATYQGMAPAARLSHTSFFDLRGVNGRPSNLYSFLKAANADGAHVHSNSWGESSLGKYTTWTLDCDAYTRDVEDDLVVFAIVNAGRVIAPENAKNVLAVGGCNTVPNQDFDGPGGLGPTFDGRRKPDVMAPGLFVRSANRFICSVGLMTGTSVACPAVAGIATLVRQYYSDGFYPSGMAHTGDGFTPTGALLKATVINGTTDMTGVDGYPSDAEGWGRVLIDDALYFPGDARRAVAIDVRHADGLETGDVRRHFVRVHAGEPLAITMTFTDQPAALATAFAPVNDLDLEVIGPPGRFRGNVFDDGESVEGGAADNLNNVERVIVREPSPGTWEIRVNAPLVPLGPQGYAIHVAGAVSTPDVALEDEPSGDAAVARTVAPQAAHEIRFDAPRPNPFASATTFELALPRAERVTLAIFDVTGRAVATLADEPLAPGRHTFSWDGRDAQRRRVAPGAYFARLTAGDDRITRKVVFAGREAP